jgi:myo-inositol-1(or 4)-monophosphatase
VTARDLSRLAREVEAALRSVRPRVAEAFRTPPDGGRRKEDGSVVTDLDVALERELVERLLAVEPSFGLVSEERGAVRAGRPTWVLDPLDGSFNFSRRIGLFAIQVALLDGEEPLVAAVYEPLRDDLTWAARGAGTWREGTRCRVGGAPPEAAVVLVDVNERGIFVEDPSLLPRLRRAVYRLRSYGSTGLHLRDVAAGTADGALGGRGRPQPLHDVAPGALLVREAGGLATDLDGRDLLRDRRTLAAGGAAVHALLLAVAR